MTNSDRTNSNTPSPTNATVTSTPLPSGYSLMRGSSSNYGSSNGASTSASSNSTVGCGSTSRTKRKTSGFVG